MKLPNSIRLALAPNVEPYWVDAFVVELRLRGVAGEAIGAALAEVESHCVESARSATEIFGEPAFYARSLDLPVDPRQEPAAIGRTVAPIIAQVIGMFAVITALPALKSGAAVDVGAGQVVWLVAFVALAVALVLAAEPILRALLSRPLLGVLAGAGLLVLLVVPSMMWPGVVAQLPGWLVLVAGLALLLGGAAWGWQAGRAEPADEITSPLSGSAQPTPSRTNWLTRLAIPAITVVYAVILLAFS